MASGGYQKVSAAGLKTDDSEVDFDDEEVQRSPRNSRSAADSGGEMLAPQAPHLLHI